MIRVYQRVGAALLQKNLPIQLTTRSLFQGSQLVRSKADESGKGSSGSEKVSEEQSAEPSAQSNDEVDGRTKIQTQIQKLESEGKDMHRKLLLKYADAENKRRERVDEIKKRDAKYISAFGGKVSAIYDSLSKVCELSETKASAPNADEKVKSFAEGLVMTRGIMKNILEKHNIGKQ
jgi:molecular chaperone GrpE (heat shock protein)